MPELENARHERFCQEYVVDLNGTQAYIRAGYSAQGAESSSSKLLRNPKVIVRISELQHEIGARLKITQESVMADLEMIKRRAVSEGQLSPAVRATELQGKHLGLFPSRHELSGPGGAPIQLNDTERAAKLAAILEKAVKRKAGK